MTDLESTAADFAVLAARLKARVGAVPGPQALLNGLRGVDVSPGDAVLDTVTGQTGVVIGTGIRNVEVEAPQT